MNQPLGAFEIWSHRRLRGYVYPLMTWVEKTETPSHYEATYSVVKTTGWAVRALNGTRVGWIFKTRKEATVRLLTDTRFNRKPTMIKNVAFDPGSKKPWCLECIEYAYSHNGNIYEIGKGKGRP